MRTVRLLSPGRQRFEEQADFGRVVVSEVRVVGQAACAPSFASGEGWGTDSMHVKLTECPEDYVGMMSTATFIF